MTRIVSLLLIIALAAVAGWYVFSPDATVRALRTAAQAGDAERVDKFVDFDAVRANLKADARAAIKRKTDDQSDNPIVTLGLTLSGALIDRFVDAFVSPAGIAALTRGKKPGSEGGADREVARDYEIDRQGLNGFVVRFADPARRAPELVFTRHGAQWEMTRIDLGATFGGGVQRD